MPLSADGILGFFDGATRCCEAFEHVSLTATGLLALRTSAAATTGNAAAASAPLRFRGTPVLEPRGAELAGSRNAGVGVIPTATVLAPAATSTTEVKGTLHVCALPEVMWKSVSAAATPAQQHLAFLSEASAFPASHNPSFAQPERNSPGVAALKNAHNTTSSKAAKGGRAGGSDGASQAVSHPGVREELPESSAFGSADDVDTTRTPPRQTLTAQRHHRDPLPAAVARYPSTEDQRRRQGSVECLSPAMEVLQPRSPAGGDGSLGVESEGIYLPGTVADLRQQPSSFVFREESMTARDLMMPATTSPTVAATAAQPRGAGEDASAASTVTVLLWVAVSAPAPGRLAEETETPLDPQTDRRAVSSRSTSWGDSHGLQLAASGAGEHGGAAETTALPACLCFAVRDVSAVESSDTDVMTTRDRRVQRLTVSLQPGSMVYAAKTTSDVFERLASASSISTAVPVGDAVAAAAGGTTPRFSPAGELSCSFVFYQGGITRCVASLRRHAPALHFNCLSGRQNSTSAMLSMLGDGSGGGEGGRGTVSPNVSSRTVSSQMSPREWQTSGATGGVHNNNTTVASLYRASPHPTVQGGDGALAEYAGWHSPAAASLEGQQQQGPHGGKSGAGGGWRNRLSPAALFRHAKDAAAPPSDATHGPPAAASATASSSQASFLPLAIAAVATGAAVAVAAGAAIKARQHSRSGEAKPSPPEQPHHRDDVGVHSSNSSFEDLTDEMTAVRLGACYVPPKPTLPPAEASFAPPTLVTAAEWEGAFDYVPQSTAATLPSSTTAQSAPNAAKSGSGGGDPPRRVRVLNADRWHAFRKSLYERGGLVDSSVRFEVWCYLLGAYTVGSTPAEQRATLDREKELYTRLTTQWKSFLPEQEEHFAVYRYAKHSVVKDVERTDRTHPAFREDGSDMLRVLQELLLAHVMYNMDLGYSQGMSDVAAVASLVAPASDEAAMFLCFRRMLSEHMANNFIIEERKKDAPYAAAKGLQRKLYQVQVLTRHFHPRLYGHLKMRCMAEDMTFCFRWLLVCFKRDLRSISDTMRFWDVLFACPYTKSYEVIVTVALLVALAPQIITHIHAYETLLQFMNVLSTGTTVDQIVHCAREFYENVCVIEARELHRQQRQMLAYASAARSPDGISGARAPATNSMPQPPAAAGGSEYHPTVEEMVLLFLDTDGPL